MKAAKDESRRFKEQYAEMASQSAGERAAVEGRLKQMGYCPEEIASVPESCLRALGCGNPTALAGLKEGQTVLDIGCGAGVDAFLAARKVGPKGKVVGVDMTAELIQRARRAAAECGCGNVEFMPGQMERLPLADESVDVVISNCVMNHALDKVAAFRETRRVLRRGGSIHIADLVTEGRIPPAGTPGLEVWAEWLTVAAGKRQYLDAVGKAGFRDMIVLTEKPFESPAMVEPLRGKIISIHLTARK
jgi:SAM-dependent methyltransferase